LALPFVCPSCGTGYPGDGVCPGDGARLAPSSDPILGQVLGSYRIARVLGEGGMGRVYLGVHPQIHSHVAIKVLSEECARDRVLVERFVAEARAVNLIRHENIVSVVDISALSDGRPYIVMERLEGESLGELLRRGPLPLGTLSRLMSDVLRGLAAAHDQGIIHRDLKPDNIFVLKSGRAKILDFGIAKLMPGVGSIDEGTRTGTLLGTPFYMAPEQALGRPVDPRSDLYSIGVILYECVTGRRPFSGTTLYELLKQHVEVEPPPPTSMRRDLSPGFEAVIRRALEKQPQHRFQSALELSRALEHVQTELGADAFAPPGSALPAHALAAPAAAPYGYGTPHAATPHGMTPAPYAHGAYGPPPAPSPTPGFAPPLSPHAVNAGSQASSGSAAAAYFGAQPGYGPPPAPAPAYAVNKSSKLPIFALVGCGFLILLIAVGGGVFVALRSAANTVANVNAVTQTNGTPGAVVATPGAAEEAEEAEFDDERFDVQAFIPKAEALAQAEIPDAKMIAMDVQGATPEGIVNFTIQSGSTVLYRFRSPARSKPPAGFPTNAAFESNCLVYVMVQGSGVNTYVLDKWACNTPITGRPRCSIKAVFKKAKALGAPVDNVIGNVGFNGDMKTPGGKLRWYVNVPPRFSNVVDDDC
jgi:serine/threonine protein kinase